MSKEAKVATMTVVAGVILYLGFGFLKGSDVFSTESDYYVIYDKLDGLSTSNPVNINGMPVGRVKSISVIQAQNNRLLVTLSIRNDIPLTVGTSALLASAGLLGGQKIELVIPTGQTRLAAEDTLVSGLQTGLMDAVGAKAPKIMSDVDTSLVKVKKVLTEFSARMPEIQALLLSTTQGMNGVQKLIADNQGNVTSGLQKVNTLLASLAETERQLKPILTKADGFADTLSRLQLRQTLQNANNAIGQSTKAIEELKALLADIQAGKGTAGKLAKDEELYRNINQTVKDLDKLLVDFRAQPKRYVHFSVFGKKKTTSPGDTLGSGQR